MPGIAIYPSAGTPGRIRGESWLFVKVAVPAVDSNMTLTLDPTNYFKTPDATENPNAVCVGPTKEGWVIGGQVQSEQEFTDESPVPVDTYIDTETREITAELYEPLNPAVLVALQGMVNTQPGAGEELLQFGGLTAIPEMSVALCFRRPDDPTKYGYVMLYQCKQVEVFNLDGLKRKGSGTMRVRFLGEALAGRAAGKQYGQIYLEV